MGLKVSHELRLDNIVQFSQQQSILRSSTGRATNNRQATAVFSPARFKNSLLLMTYIIGAYRRLSRINYIFVYFHRDLASDSLERAPNVDLYVLVVTGRSGKDHGKSLKTQG